MTFVEDDGTEVKVEADVGASLLEVAHDNDVDLEGESLAYKTNTSIVITRGTCPRSPDCA